MFLLKESDQERRKILEGIPELHPGMGIFEFGWKCLGYLKKWMFATFAVIVLAEISNICLTYTVKLIVDTLSLSSGSPSSELLHTVLLLVSLNISIAFLGYVIIWRTSGFLASHYGNALWFRSEYALFHYISLHNPGYFFNHFAGSLATKIRNVSDGYFDLLDAIHWTLIGVVISFIGTSILFIYIHWVLVLIVISWIIAYTGVYFILGRKKRLYSKKKAEQQSIKTGALVDIVTNMLTVTLFSQRTGEGNNLSKTLYSLFDILRASWRYSEFMNILSNMMTIMAMSALFFTTIWLWYNKLATPGDFILVLILGQSINGALKNVGNLMNRLNQSLGTITEGLETLLVPHGVLDVPKSKPLKVTSGKIEFQNISFAYEGRKNVLHDFYLDIKPGEKVGLVGRSGAGKTSLVSLLLRFYDVDGGIISIDGQDLSQITQESLRSNIAVVPQESMLFHRSILENIRYGDEKANDKQVQEAAKLAQAHDFIMELPDGYDTKVGERGVKLSGGQRQRVAIARAILKNAPILVLDEATASLDSESEIAISKALHNLVKDKTVIAIAHRLSTLREMTRIIVMDEGKIIESGTHEKLLKKGGLYADLWKAQAGGFLAG